MSEIDWKETMLIQNILYKLCVEWYAKSKEKENITYSSHSMFIAFALLYLGSDKKTREEIGEVFGFSRIPKEKFEPIILALLGNNEEIKEVIISIVNGIWLSNKTSFKKEYLETVKKYKTELQTVDFGKSEIIRKEINTWVETITRNIIKDFLPEGTITPDTVSVIVNAIYFKGEWDKPFKVMEKPLLFNGNQNVTGMKEKISSGAIFTEEFVSVNIPYQDRDYSLVLIMPENMKQFEEKYIDKMNEKDNKIEEIIRNTRQEMSEKRNVTIPKFKIESTIQMTQQLQEMGMKEAFGGCADFSKMCNEHISVSDAIHKCVVDVDEKGTEAAAATGIMMMRMCMPMQPPKDVIINKPFFFAIVGTDLNIPLFFGKITHPKHN